MIDIKMQFSIPLVFFQGFYWVIFNIIFSNYVLFIIQKQGTERSLFQN